MLQITKKYQAYNSWIQLADIEIFILGKCALKTALRMGIYVGGSFKPLHDSKILPLFVLSNLFANFFRYSFAEPLARSQ